MSKVTRAHVRLFFFSFPKGDKYRARLLGNDRVPGFEVPFPGLSPSVFFPLLLLSVRDLRARFDVDRNLKLGTCDWMIRHHFSSPFLWNNQSAAFYGTLAVLREMSSKIHQFPHHHWFLPRPVLN